MSITSPPGRLTTPVTAERSDERGRLGDRIPMLTLASRSS